MASVTFKRGTRAEIEATAKQDGQILMETDQNKKNKMYIDLPDGSRVLIGNSGEAIDTSYDNITSGLDATNVQDAIDKIENNVGDISGITDSLTATSSNIALSAAGGNNLQGQINTLNSSLTNIYDVTSELQYRYCREVSGRNKLIKCGNMMFLTVVVVTTTALTNSENYIIKIPKKYLPKQSVYGAIQTNAYGMDVIPFAVSAIDDWNVIDGWNLWLSYQKLNNQTIPTDRWLWGTISWIIGG